MPSRIEGQCEVCDRVQKVPEYGDWTCERCGQRYVYGLGHGIVLTDEQKIFLQWLMLKTGRGGLLR